MGKKEENASFICINCQREVLPLQNGSYRNHCPFCLISVHIDNQPGDRQNMCRGIMIPCRVQYKGNKGWQLIHVCQTCRCQKTNKIAEGNPQPDDWDAIVVLSQSPLI